MSRWAINDYSDEEEDNQEEDQNDEQAIKDEPQNDEQVAPKGDDDNASDNEDETENRSNLSDKQKKYLDLKQSLGKVLDNITLNQIKKAHEEFTKLQNIYKRPPKVIKKNENPHFFIRELFEITQKVKELDKSEKDIRKFEQDVKKFNRGFEKELQECEENPEKFANDDDEDEDDQNKNASDDSGSDNGGWFVSSDDEETNKNDDNKNDDKTGEEKENKPRHHKDMTSAEAVEARLKAERNRVINDSIAQKELEEFSASRIKGKVTTDVPHLNQLYKAVKDKELSHKLQLEICFTVEEGPSDQAIPLENWTLILEFLPSLINDAKLLVPLFERLNRDFWARSVHPRHLFTPDVARLHEILPNFIKIMEDYSKKLRDEKEFALCTRLENMLIEHIYHKDTVDIMPHTLSILELLNQKIFDESVTNSFRARAALFLAFNLAVRKYPLSAADVFSRIPMLTSSATENSMNQVLSNRTSAQIGIAAFNEGYYKLSYQCLKKFSSFKYVDKNLGQDPPVYPPWLLIDKKVIISMHLLSAMLLDLPYLTVGIKDESKLLIKNKMHKDLINKNLPTGYPEHQKISLFQAIDHARVGEWKKANSVAVNEVGDKLINSEKFLDNLKKVSLCCFLLTARNYYESIKFEYLVKRFELSNEVVLEVTNDMINGIGPIEKAPIEFRGKLSPDNKFILFDNQEVESPFAEYGTVIQVKSQTMKESLESLNK